jgi:uncharacterized protein (DUF2252 family)
MTTKPRPVAHLTIEQRVARGKDHRKRLPRSSLGDWSSPSDRRSPLDILEEQAVTRVPDLVPIRYGRMSASAFAYYRGAAAVMAADLASLPRSDLEVQLCGDAHLANFGGFASPERSLVFDLNDFDETLPGPFEWDVKRLVASLEVAARDRAFTSKEARRVVLAGARAYREALRSFARMSNLDIWYSSLDVDTIGARWGTDAGANAIKGLQRVASKAESKDRLRAKAKLTEVVDGTLRIRNDPPLLVPSEQYYSETDHVGITEIIRGALRAYRQTLTPDRRTLLEGYQYVDMARKVVGVGSVGMRAWVVLMVGRDQGDPLFLQVKEAEASVLESHLKRSTYRYHGRRVVEGQRLMQASSDIFLGWHRVEKGIDGRSHDYFIRQLWDWKASADIERMSPDLLGFYAEMCGWTLARAHARSGDPIAMAEYLGSNATFDNAMASFAAAYADQNDRDYAELTSAIADGRLDAVTGV